MSPIPIQPETPESPGTALDAVALRFIELFARALHRFGLPAHRVEAALVAIAERLGYEGGFFATPTAIFITLTRGDEQRTTLLRLEPGEVNLDKLGRLDAVLRGLIDGTTSPADGSAAVEAIVGDRDRHGSLAIAAGYTLAAVASSRFFGGGVREAVVSAAIGLAIGSLAWVASRFTERFRVFESTAAFLAGLVAAVASVWLEPVSVFVTTGAGMIALLPGLSLTLAINELATRNLTSGAVRLANALLTFMQIGFGLAVGLELGTLLAGAAPTATPEPLGAWTLLVAVVLMSIALTILFQASPRDFGWILASALVAFTTARYAANLGGPELGAFLSALAVGLASNAYGRIRNRSANALLIPGIMLIVPGSLGFRSVASLLEADVVGGIQFAFTMIMTGVALVTGLLIARGIVPPRRSV